MATLIDHKGLEVPDVTPGDGGQAIKDNFVNLVDWHPKSTWDAVDDPDANDDDTENYYPGSFWLNTSTSTLFVCLNNATGAATWQRTLLQVVQDTSPKLGGDLDVNGNAIISTAGTLTILGAETNATSTPGGNVSVTAGEALGTTSAGGIVSIVGGEGTSSGGNVQLQAATGGTSNGSVRVNNSGTDTDFIVAGDTATNLLVCDAGLDAVQIGTTTAGVIADFRSTSIVINENSADIDFRIESDGDANNFVSDAGTNRIGMGVLAPAAKLHVFPTSTTEHALQIKAGDNGDGSGNIIRCFNNSDTMIFLLRGSGRMDSWVNGTDIFHTSSTEFVVNDSGGNVDLRCEGDTVTHLFFTDASTDRIGVAQSSPAYRFQINAPAVVNAPALFLECSTGDQLGGMLFVPQEDSSGGHIAFNGAVDAYSSGIPSQIDGDYTARVSGVLGMFLGTNAEGGTFFISGAPQGTNQALTQYFKIAIAGPSAGTVIVNDSGLSTADFTIEGDTDTSLFFTDASVDRVGIGASSLSGKLHVDQASTTAAIPVLTVDQADVSEEFIRFIGSSANGVLTQSIVEAVDVTTATIAGYLKIYVQDDGNQLTDQAYYVPIYTLT